MIAAFQWDLGRQVERLDWLLAQLPRYADWGYRELYLHLEDAVEFPSLPGVARRDAYSQRQLGRLVAAASRVGIGVVPIVNLLGHTQYLIKVPGLRDLNELRSPDGSALPQGQVCPLHPRTLEVADALMGDVAAFCTAGRIHVGLDESFSLGRHPRSAAEIAEIGLARHFAGHVQRLNTLALARGLRLGMWADMLALIPEAIPHLPRGISAYDWYYYPFGERPRMELHNFREYELAPALGRQGIEYWGCPMNGSFRHEPLPVFGERLANIRAWWRRCLRVEAAGMLVTSWEPNRLAMGVTTAVDAAAACLWLDPAIEDSPGMLERGFARAWGARGARQAARESLACDDRAFVGYARWEINERWDGCVSRRGIARLESERAFFARLLSRGRTLPSPLRASVRFRLYLAERDVFVHEAAASVLALRRMAGRHGPQHPKVRAAIAAFLGRTEGFSRTIRRGRAGARSLWALSRDPRVRGPNERIVAQDGARLRRLRRWIRGCRSTPARLFTASPVAGRWQLTLDVVLREPALQRLVVETQTQHGTWAVLAARTSIEFRSRAARPRTLVRRELSVPVPGPGSRLRIGVRGLGRIGIANVELTDGLAVLRPKGLAARETVIGRTAPARGFPSLDWESNAGCLKVPFSG